MDISNRDFIHGDPSASTPPNLLPPWLSKPMTLPPTTSSPSVTLTLSPSTAPPPPPPPSSTTTAIPWLQSFPDPSFASSSYPSYGIETHHGGENGLIVSEVLQQCCNELEEKQRAWAAHKKESAWRLKRVELQLESEKACKRREKMEETEAKIKALRQEQQAIMDRIEAEYKEQLSGLRRDAEIKEQKLAEQWAVKHRRLMDFVHQMGCQPRTHDFNG